MVELKLVIKSKSFMINTLTKKRVMWESLFGSIVTILLLWRIDINTFVCQLGVVNPPVFSCAGVMIAYMLAISMPIFIFSLVTYYMKDDVFLLWRKFTIQYLVIYLLIIAIAPWQHDPFFPVEKELMVMVLGSIYSLVSIILITYKSFTLRKKG